MLKVNIITSFPNIFPGPLGISILEKAMRRGFWSMNIIDIREFAVKKVIDDTPYGGGPGMILKPDVLASALDSCGGKIFNMSPRGIQLCQSTAKSIIEEKEITVICSRFEGIDQRVLNCYNSTDISVGDYIISGGELAAMVFIDCCVRLIPGVINELSVSNDSFSSGLLECDHYTKPRVWNSVSVPDVLLNGDHKKIDSWRRDESIEITKVRRPDLWMKYKGLKNE